MARFSDQVVIVTGGTGELGQSVSTAFLSEGATVVIFGRSAESFETMKAELDNSPRLGFQQADLTDEGSVNAAINAVLEQHRRIDAVVNVAGGYFGGVPVAQMPTDRWDQMMRLNLNSVFYVCRAALPSMIARKSGAIVNVGSRAGESGVGGLGAYSVSKAGVRVLTEAIAEEVKHDGVRANCVLPSVIDTPANRKAIPNADFDTWVKPEVIAQTILFLASDEASATSGASIPVYGRA
ncbi:MAG: SDR family NAD(P)-dependent oxidoreductase [Candidatus Poribacteria bacterium]|nr:SDR family NAD(P)-dependent oxidoreductase [Candidatus Poribacteria bacterium]